MFSLSMQGSFVDDSENGHEKQHAILRKIFQLNNSASSDLPLHAWTFYSNLKIVPVKGTDDQCNIHIWFRDPGPNPITIFAE